MGNTQTLPVLRRRSERLRTRRQRECVARLLTKSMAEADAAVLATQSLPMSMVVACQDESKCAELESAGSFPQFLQLPLELQINIWTYTLEAPRVEPRVVRVTYDEKIDSFSYSFTIPPLLEVCQISRKIVRHFYPSLVPDSAFPIYINPGIDFLYCISPPHNPNPPIFGPNQVVPILPFIDTTANVADIRYLVLDDTYWKHRYLANRMTAHNTWCSIEEMRRFQNIEELFIVGLSLEQWLERRKNLLELASYPNPPDQRRFKDHVYAAQVERRKALPNSPVPGFCVDTENSEPGYSRRGELRKCFGVQRLPASFPLNGHGIPARPWTDEEVLDKRYWSKMPKLTIISASLI
jgi:hypothetical protein